MRPCTEEDINTYFAGAEEFYLPFLREAFCPSDTSLMKLYGDYNAVESRFARITITECID